MVKIFGGREDTTRRGVFAGASTDVVAGRVLMATHSTQGQPPAPEVDPFAEFKKSNAYARLRSVGVINEKCEIVNPYFRVERIETSDELGQGFRGKKTFNVVYKVLAVYNTIKPTIVFLSRNSGQDSRTERGNLNGTLWDWILSHATEADYARNKNEDRGYIYEHWGA